MGDEVACAECGKSLEEAGTLQVQHRQPCPDCGSVARAYAASVRESVSADIKMKTRHRSPGTNRFKLEHTLGDDLHRKSGTWNVLDRRIDRLADRYDEIIVDPVTNKIVHECHESLSEHSGHGSARIKDK